MAKDVSVSLDKFEHALDEDLEALACLDEIIEASTQSYAALVDLKARTPEKMLPKETDPSSVPSLSEFEAIPKATRLRISYDTMVQALIDIRKVIDRKSKLVHTRTPRNKLSHPRKVELDEYESRKVSEHEDLVL